MRKYIVLTVLSVSVLAILFLFVHTKTSKLIDNEPPSDWFITQRMYPYDKIDYDAYQEALQQANLMTQNSRQMSTNPQWQLAGPTNLEGRVSDIEMNPANQQEIYVGAASGGVFKSIDGGATWNPIFDQNSSLSIGDIAVAPSNPNIIYVGTGEANGGSGSITYDGQGVFKSLNGGSTWINIGLKLTRNTGKIVIHPKDPNTVFVGTMGDLYGKTPDRGVYKTTNGGTTWQQVLYVNDSVGVIDMAINPKCPDTLYAATYERVRKPNNRNYGGPGCNIYRSFDGGNTWVKLTIGLPSPSPTCGRIGLDISASNPNVVFAIYADMTGNCIGVYKTVNNGNSWYQVDGGTASGVYGTQGWWYGHIKVDPIDTSIAYAVGFDLYKTTNGGRNWTNITSVQTHVDHHALYIHPQNNNLVLNGNDGGLYLSYDAGTSFTANAKIPNMQFYTTEIDYQNPTTIYGGAQDNGTNGTNNSLNNWFSINGGDGFYCLVDPTNSSNIIAEYQYGNISTSTAGLNANANERHNWNTPLTLNPKNPKSIYYGSNYLYKSTDYWQTWNPISPDLTDGASTGNLVFNTITTISVSRADTNVIYVGTDDGNVQVSQDNGTSWTNISTGLPKRWVTHVKADPLNAGIAYVTLSGYRYHDSTSHIFKTINYGSSWVDIGYNLPSAPVNDVVIDSANNSTLYVATDVGCYYTTGGSNNWLPLGMGLPLVPVLYLTIHNPTHKLVAATYGRSMYTLDLNQLATSITSVSKQDQIVSVFPNPVATETTIKVDHNKDHLFFKLYDTRGILVKEIELTTEETKFYRSDLKTGVYFYRIFNKDKLIQSGKMVLI